MHRLVVNDPAEIGKALHGEAYTEYRRLLDEAVNKRYSGKFPIQIDFDTIDACNLNCPVCSDKGRDRNGKKINAQGIRAVIDEGAGMGLYSMNIGACGEPFMNSEDLFGLCDHARSKGVLDIFVHSNFLLPDEEDVRNLVDAGVTQLCLSVDAAGPEVYAKTRGGDFEKLVENVRYLRDYRKTRGLPGPSIRVSAVPCRANHEELQQDFFPFWKEYADVVEIQCFQETPFQEPGLNVLTRRMEPDCSTAFWRLMFWPDNSAAACCSTLGMNEDLVLTRQEIGTYSVSELWTGEKIESIRRKVLDGDWKSLPSCATCFKNTFVWE